MASPILHRHIKHIPPLAVRGEGCFLIDSLGKVYLDACGGTAISCLGHGHQEVIAAIQRQVEDLAYAHTSFFSSAVAEELAQNLLNSGPPGLSHVYFVSGGSEAVEAAMKMARQYFVEIGKPQRTQFIARRQSYHGNTLGALAVSGHPNRRESFEAILMDTSHVSPCYPYREQHSFESDEDYVARLASELEATIVKAGTDRVIAFVAETVGGATAGVLPPVPGYFKTIKEVCDKYGVLLILDEVMCGMGRTGSLHACTQEGVTPDLLAVAKGLGGGYQPIGAMLAHERIVDAMGQGSGFFQHGHAYLGHPVACAAALTVQKILARDGWVEHVASNGAKLGVMLTKEFGDHPYVGDVRGRGYLWGVELVRNKETKTPFDPSLQIHAKIKSQAFANGLLCYPTGGTIDGFRGDHILLAPPYIASEAELTLMIDLLSQTINQVV